MSIVAIIPARGGSKGVPGKNKKLLGGIPLVARTIRAANSATLIDCVYVTSDDLEILSIATEWGAEKILRPAELSSDSAGSEEALIHALGEIKNSKEVTAFVFLQCTSPFTSGEMIDAVVSSMQLNKAQSAFSAIEDHGFIWQTGSTGVAVGVNHDEQKLRKRRQDLDPQYRETGAVYAMEIGSFLSEKNRFCGKSILVPVEGFLFEIDTYADWRLAEALLEEGSETSAPNVVLDGLKAVVMDFDGVLTDDKVIVTEAGDEAVVCSRSDGMGVELLRESGMKMMILSKEQNPVVMQRAKKLKLEVLHGVDDKVNVLEAWLKVQGLKWGDIAYVGNDINDLGCLSKARVGCVPSDAHKAVLKEADIILPEKGGNGAIRSLADLLLSVRDET